MPTSGAMRGPGNVLPGNVLVVDDEPYVAGILAEIMTMSGHAVDTADNGVSALEKLARRDYDLIMSDIRMPRLDGPGLYREVSTRYPHLAPRFVFMSGNLTDENAEFVARAGVRLLHKPFRVADVQAIARQIPPAS